MGNIPQTKRRGFIAAVGFVTLLFTLEGSRVYAEPTTNAEVRKKRVAVLSTKPEPSAKTSQGLYIAILKAAGFEARAISGEEVRAKKLVGFDIFVIGGGSGTAFNMELGEEGGKVVKEFIRNGGGALASCAGAYSFVNGNNEVRKYVAIANAKPFDFEDGRWARGRGVVEITPMDDRYRPVKMFYANGPLWEIAKKQGADRTVALASFNSDVKKDGDPGGIMPGTPAILGGTYGDGRFVLFSGHPEFHKRLGNYPMVSDAANWVTRGSLKADEPILWADVFPNAGKLEAAQDKPDRGWNRSTSAPE